MDDEALVPGPTEPRQDAHQGQVPRRVQRPPAAGAGEGVPLQPLHHHPAQGRAGRRSGPQRAPGQNLVPEPARQGAQAGQEAGGAAAPRPEDGAAAATAACAAAFLRRRLLLTAPRACSSYGSPTLLRDRACVCRESDAFRRRDKDRPMGHSVQ